MPHLSTFRCRIKTSSDATLKDLGPVRGQKPQPPSVGRGLRPRRPLQQIAQLLSLQFYPPERERRPPACIYGPLLPVRPLELQPQNCADRLRSRSPSAQPSGASSRGPPHSVSSARLGRKGEPHGIYPRQSSAPRGRTTGPPGRRGGNRDRASRTWTRGGDARMHGNPQRSPSSSRRGETVTRHKRYHLDQTGIPSARRSVRIRLMSNRPHPMDADPGTIRRHCRACRTAPRGSDDRNRRPPIRHERF